VKPVIHIRNQVYEEANIELFLQPPVNGLA
jgi:hypothetical protein